jgi:hypothetical protein
MRTPEKQAMIEAALEDLKKYGENPSGQFVTRISDGTYLIDEKKKKNDLLLLGQLKKAADDSKKLRIEGLENLINDILKAPETYPWYTIPEIKPADFLRCIKPLYTVLEGTHKSKSNEDIFLKSMLLGHNKLTEEQWTTAEKARLAHKALEGKMGDFHEELMGCFPGYKNLPQGHSSGCDVASVDDTLFMEVKNRDNTLNSGGGAHVVAYLKKLTDAGKRGILVEVNCPGGRVTRFGAHPSVEVWNGQKAYAFLSGRETFFDDLAKTLKYVSAAYMTYPELKSALETA